MKCLLFFYFILAVTFAFECPSSKWFRLRDKCYLKEFKRYSFQENFDFCESQGATTVSVHSEEENNFISAKLSSYTTFWLGISQVDFDNQSYAWLDGSSYNYSNWVDREGEKSCAGAYILAGAWFDIRNCNDKNYAFCQIDSPFYPLQLQLNQWNQDLKQMKADMASLNETNSILDKILNATNVLIKYLNSTFEEKLNEKLNNSLTKSTLLIEYIKQSIFDNKMDNKLAHRALNENINQSMALFWVFGTVLLSTLCVSMFVLYLLFVKRFRRQTKEIKLADDVTFERKPFTENI